MVQPRTCYRYSDLHFSLSYFIYFCSIYCYGFSGIVWHCFARPARSDHYLGCLDYYPCCGSYRDWINRAFLVRTCSVRSEPFSPEPEAQGRGLAPREGRARSEWWCGGSGSPGRRRGSRPGRGPRRPGRCAAPCARGSRRGRRWRARPSRAGPPAPVSGPAGCP